MQWGIGEKKTDPIKIAMNLKGQPRTIRYQYYRALGTGQQVTTMFIKPAVFFRHHQIPNHHREGLVRTLFALAQQGYCRSIACIADNVEAPDPLDGKDLPPLYPLCYLLQGVLCGDFLAVGSGQRQLWPTDRAGGGLGMKTAISWIPVLLLTVITQGRRRQGGCRAIIRQITDNGIAGATIGAVV